LASSPLLKDSHSRVRLKSIDQHGPTLGQRRAQKLDSSVLFSLRVANDA
jgi:hypothetical protein